MHTHTHTHSLLQSQHNAHSMHTYTNSILSSLLMHAPSAPPQLPMFLVPSAVPSPSALCPCSWHLQPLAYPGCSSGAEWASGMVPSIGVGGTQQHRGKGWGESTHPCLSFSNSWAVPSEGGARRDTYQDPPPQSTMGALSAAMGGLGVTLKACALVCT